ALTVDFFTQADRNPTKLHSFPTRRSSDLGLLREHEGVAAQVLMNLGLKLEEVREEVLNLLGAGVDPEEAAKGGGSPSGDPAAKGDRKSTRLNSSHVKISYAVFCLKKKKIQ